MPSFSNKRLRALLLAATVAAGGAGFAAVHVSAQTYDPAQLPAFKGQVAGYSLTPRGDVDGLILADGTEIHLPPHLGTQLVFAVKPGDSVTVRGLKAREVPMVQAMQVTNDASNLSVTDNGPPAHGPMDRHGPMGGHGPMMGGPGGPGPMDGPDMRGGAPAEIQSKVRFALHGPRGDLNGALLEDGTIVRLPPPEAQRLKAQLVPGQALFVSGELISSPLGKLVLARSVGADKASATPIKAPPPPPPGERRGPPNGGPGAPPPPPPPGAGRNAAPPPPPATAPSPAAAPAAEPAPAPAPNR